MHTNKSIQKNFFTSVTAILLSLVVMLIGPATGLIKVAQVKAAPLTDVSITAGSYIAGENTNYVFNYTIETPPMRFIWRPIDFVGVGKFDITNSTAEVIVDGVVQEIDAFWKGTPYIELTYPYPEVAGSTVQVTIFDVINPSTPGTYSITVATAQGQGHTVDSAVVPVVIRSKYASGTGTQNDPYILKTVEHFEDLFQEEGNGQGLYFKLDNDITIVPGDDFRASSFSGNFDGDGHTIGGLTSNLFNDLGGSAVVENLFVEGNNNLSGYNFSSSVGLLTGYAEDATVRNVSVSGTVSVSVNNSCEDVGGMIGYASNVTIHRTHAAVNVTGERCENVGGLIGTVEEDSVITESFATGAVSGKEVVGGLVGKISGESRINNSYARGSVSGDEYVGGLVGSHNGYPIRQTYATGAVTGDAVIGGLIAATGESMAEYSFWDVETTGQLGSAGGGEEGMSSADMKDQYTYTLYIESLDGPWDFEDTWTMSEEINDGYPCLQWAGELCTGPTGGSESPYATVTTGIADTITQTSAVVYGTAQLHRGLTIDDVVNDPDISETGLYLYTSYETREPLDWQNDPWIIIDPADVEADGDDTNLVFQGTITGLTCDTTYYYDNSWEYFDGQSEWEWADELKSFTTLACDPEDQDDGVTTLAATNITRTSATLNGSIGNDTEYMRERGFDYGFNTNYGQVLEDDYDSNNPKGGYSLELTGLACGTTYYFRAKAEIGYDVITNSTGDDMSFTTLSCGVSSSGGSSGGSRRSGGSIFSPSISTENIVSTTTTLNEGQCSIDTILTQNMRAGARDGKYHWYTKAIVTEVKILQGHMNRLGFKSGPVDGILGPITDGAIKRMQVYLGTKADGYVGPITRSLINKSCGVDGLPKI